MRNPATAFLNVDLHLESATDLLGVCEALGRAVMVLHHGTSGRRHRAVLELARAPKTPTEAIRRFARLAARLRGRAKATWLASDKELDIGIQAGLEPDPAEWIIDAKAVAAAAQLGARLRLTVYASRARK